MIPEDEAQPVQQNVPDMPNVDTSMLSPADLAFIKKIDYEENGNYKCCLQCLGNCQRDVCMLCICCGCGYYKKVTEGHVGLVKETGRYVRKIGPGLHAYNPCTEQIRVVDLRTRMINIPPQPLLTKDNVQLQIDTFCTFRIIVPELALFKVADHRQVIILKTQGCLKAIISEHTLTEILTNRKVIEDKLCTIIDE